MKNLIIILIITCSTISLSAQQRGQRGQWDPETRVKRQTEQMVKDLDLNKDQEKQVSELNTKYMKKSMDMMREMRESGDGWEGMREKMDEMNTEKNKELKKILTKDQFKKYLTIEEKRAKERRSRMGRRR